MSVPNIPVLSQLAHLIEYVLKAEGPAVGKAAGEAAAQTAMSDPKVQAVSAASVALLKAAQDLKAATAEPGPTK